MLEIHPPEIRGPWGWGYVLDIHTISSTMGGFDAYGHRRYGNVGSSLGEAVYRLKYQSDRSVLPDIVETITVFLNSRAVQFDPLVPVPSSNARRAFQPVSELAIGVATALVLLVRIRRSERPKRRRR
jgi:predicted amidophosphoribosyltransferase